jgi:hypothetical protein
VSLLSQRFVLPSGVKLTSALEVALSSIAKSLAPVLPAWPRQRLGEQENGTTKLEEPIRPKSVNLPGDGTFWSKPVVTVSGQSGHFCSVVILRLAGRCGSGEPVSTCVGLRK